MAASFEEFTETELARLDAERIEDDKLRAGQLLNYVLRGKGGLLPSSGLVLEFGVLEGRSINKLARVLEQPIFGFDSFEGLPEDWDVGNTVIPRETFDRQGSLPQVLPNVVLIKGWFEETLPHFVQLFKDPLRLLHVDCDLYSSTRTVFQYVGDRIVPGTIIVFDDMINYPTFREGEWRAWYELVVERDLGFDWFPTFGGVRRDFTDYKNMRDEAAEFRRDPEAALVVTRVGSAVLD
jgi:hypothetical protein